MKTKPSTSKLLKDGAVQNDTVAQLRARGNRITILRAELVALLESASQPLSPSELVETLHGKALTFNKTSVYRELQFLRDAGFVLELDLRDGSKRYELSRHEDHHHHLICTHCGGITCAEVCFDQTPLAKTVRRLYGFEITGHTLDFHGVCQACRASAHG